MTIFKTFVVNIIKRSNINLRTFLFDTQRRLNL